MSQPGATVATKPLTARLPARLTSSLTPRLGSSTRRLAAAMLLIALAACQSGEESGQPGEERKSPFATGNVSVAPQIDGRPAAPTPIPAPRPTFEP